MRTMKVLGEDFASATKIVMLTGEEWHTLDRLRDHLWPKNKAESPYEGEGSKLVFEFLDSIERVLQNCPGGEVAILQMQTDKHGTISIKLLNPVEHSGYSITVGVSAKG